MNPSAPSGHLPFKGEARNPSGPLGHLPLKGEARKRRNDKQEE